jgi:hypothetical protein
VRRWRPMELSQNDINEFKAIYLKNFGEEISDEEAWPMARNLLHLMTIITEPLPDSTDAPVQPVKERPKRCKGQQLSIFQ